MCVKTLPGDRKERGGACKPGEINSTEVISCHARRLFQKQALLLATLLLLFLIPVDETTSLIDCWLYYSGVI